MAATLGVPTLEYLPWAILNYTGTSIDKYELPVTNATVKQDAMVDINKECRSICTRVQW